MLQGSKAATAAAAAVAAGVVVGKALAQEDALLRLRLRLAQFFRGQYTLRDVRIPESLLPIELRGAADAEGLVACDVAVKHGLIDEVAPPKSLGGIDCNGCLVVACFADGHTHLVKTHAHPRARNATAVFVARNCASRSSREQTITKLHAKLVGGVDRPGQCMNNRPWPMCREAGKEPKKCGKHALLRNYPFYLAFENSIDVDYVSEKVFHALEAGTLPVYLGASNVKDFVPHRSVVALRDHGSAEALAAYLKSLLDDPALYDSYFEWKRRPLPESFVSKFGFVATHAKCRLCRWAYATRHGYTWDQRRQIISDLPER